MARYGLINLDKLKADAKSIDVNSPVFKAVKEAVEHYHSAILTPEETEAKFLEVFNYGEDYGEWLYNEFWTALGKEAPKTWGEVKQTL